jgi:hypothetical protein
MMNLLGLHTHHRRLRLAAEPLEHFPNWTPAAHGQPRVPKKCQMGPKLKRDSRRFTGRLAGA